MPVEVHEHDEAVFVDIFEISDQFLERVDGWVENFFWLSEFTVQVFARNARPVVPENHPIRVQHRDNLEDNSDERVSIVV